MNDQEYYMTLFKILIIVLKLKIIILEKVVLLL